MFGIIIICLFGVTIAQIPIETSLASKGNKINLISQWTSNDFEFPTHPFKASVNNSNYLVRKNIIATRAQTVNDRVFLALPRYKHGVPATLVRMSTNPFTSTITLSPFPSWTLQEEGNCKALQSVVDIVVDQHGILWALDTGVVNKLETPIRKCPAKIVAFNVASNKVLKTINLYSSTILTSQLQSMAVEYLSDGSCFVYVSDVNSRAIIVINVQKGKSFRVILPRSVSSGYFSRGVFNIALVHHETPELYLNFWNSKNLFSIETKHLRSSQVVGHIKDLGLKPFPMAIIGTDNGATIFFRNDGEAEVFQWDTKTPLIENNFTPIYRSPKHMLATHILPDYKRDTMLVLQSNVFDFFHNRVSNGVHQQLLVI